MLRSLLLFLLYFQSPEPPARVDLLGHDRMVCTDVYTLSARVIPGAKYHWENGDTTPSIEVRETGTYYLSITTPKGGTLYDEVYLNFDLDGILLPNYISYNCGYLPVWNPECLTLMVPHPEEFRLTLYDRWGTLLLDAHDPETGWCPHETQLPEGSYFYRVETLDCDGVPVELTSHVTFQR